MKKNIFYICIISLIVLILCRSEYVIEYVKDSINICYELIIPTLFPFFVCSGLLIYSGFGGILAKFSQKFMRPLFNVSPSGAAAFVLGIISGFPLGAITAVQLYRCGNISKSEAERLLAFCNNSGPLFIIGSIGTAIYGKPVWGALLYAIHIFTSVAVGIIFGFYNKNKHTAPPTRLNTVELTLSEVFSKALSEASKNIITVCFSIIFFSTISRVLLVNTNLPNVLDTLISGIFEFSTGTLKTSMLDRSLYEKLILTSFIVGFSGICVHIQVMAVTAGSGLSLKPYILGKALHGIIAALLSAAVFRFINIPMEAFSDCSHRMSASFAIVPIIILSGISVLMLCSAILFLRNKAH